MKQTEDELIQKILTELYSRAYTNDYVETLLPEDEFLNVAREIAKLIQ